MFEPSVSPFEMFPILNIANWMENVEEISMMKYLSILFICLQVIIQSNSVELR